MAIKFGLLEDPIRKMRRAYHPGFGTRGPKGAVEGEARSLRRLSEVKKGKRIARLIEEAVEDCPESRVIKM